MRVLSIVHEAGPTGGGGIFERAVPERGHRLDRWVAADGDAPPGAPTDWEAVMVFGGAMHPDQDAEHPWLAGEAGFLETALAEGVPLLGVCLGAQLIARAAGAWVGPAGEAEVGWYEVSRDDGADPVLEALPGSFHAFQWHYYTFDLPPGAVQLASSAAARQAYRLGDRAWGIQFHAEVSAADAEHWIEDYRSDDDAVRIGVEPEALRAETRQKIAAWNDLGRELCGRFLALASK